MKVILDLLAYLPGRSLKSVARIAFLLGMLTTISACSSNQDSSSTTSSETPAVAETESDGESSNPEMQVVEGDPQPLGDGEVKSFVIFDENEVPISMGLRFSKESLENLPQNCETDAIPETSFWEFCFGGKMNDALITILETPPAAVAATNVATMELSWLPFGHAPEGIWDQPQFDIHFNFVAPTGGTDEDRIYTEPGPGELPEGYMILPGSGFPWDTPAQQSHSHSADPQISPEFSGGEFTTNFLYITYDGKVIGYEPYVTLAHLLEYEELVEIPIKAPEIYPNDGYYPNSLQVGFDAATDSYVIAISDFEAHEALEVSEPSEPAAATEPETPAQ